MMVIGLGPWSCCLRRYQQHSPHPLRWWELPAYGAAFALYVYLWAIASLVAWSRLVPRADGVGEDATPRPRRSAAVRVVAVLGTRPEVIKLAPVVAELRAEESTECVVVATGQHRELLDQMLEQFELEADVDLDVMRPEQRLADLTARARPRARRDDFSLRAAGLGARPGRHDDDVLCGALAAFYEASR